MCSAVFLLPVAYDAAVIPSHGNSFPCQDKMGNTNLNTNLRWCRALTTINLTT